MSPAAKPPKLTADLIDEYLRESELLSEASKSLKPVRDKVNQLLDQIHQAMLATGKDKKKVGQHVVLLTTKRGSVSWKKELVSRLTSEELKAIEDAAPEVTSVEIKAA